MRSYPIRRLLVPALLLWTVACAVNPATGRRELSLIGEGSEIQMGREANGQIAASMGLVEDEGLQAYVSELGHRLATVSERPTLPWTFQVVDDPLVNAFALPGGYIFVTRGILAHFESEAELVGVLGHEIGHVTARHSVSQMSRQQLQQLGLGLGMVFSETVRQYADIGATAIGLLNLRYSRGDETESDELGVRYMTRAGYDAEAMVGVFEMLAAVGGGGEAEGRAPEWALTHPYPENREEHIRSVIAREGAVSGGDPGRDRYLDRIDGLVYGENPREGYFKGSRFLHPALAFQLDFPGGWSGVNQKSAVAAVSPGKDALVVLEFVPEATDPDAAMRAFLAQEGIRGGTVRRSEDYGIATVRVRFSATTQDGALEGEVAFLRHGESVLRILGYASASAWSGVASSVGVTLGSFAPVTDQAVLSVQPRRLEIVRLPEAMTMEAFHRRYPSAVSLEEVARLNRVAPGDRLQAGSRVKRVTGAPLP